jgi:hypothetical protein
MKRQTKVIVNRLSAIHKQRRVWGTLTRQDIARGIQITCQNCPVEKTSNPLLYGGIDVVTNRPHFGCYSPVRTGSAGQVPDGDMVSGGKTALASKVGPVYIYRHPLLLR